MKLTKRTATAALLLSVTVAGCSDDGSPSTGGASGSSTGGTSSGSAGKTSGGSGGSGTGGSGTSGGGQGSGTAGSNTGTFANEAACGERGMAKASATAYEGTAEFYIIGEAGLGTDVCTIRYDVKRVEAGEAGCADCSWTHLVEYSNPSVVLNMEGACDASDSDPQLDAAGRATLDGARVSLGFSPAAGHGSQLMKYDESMKAWIAVGRSSWSESSGEFGYDINTGQCNYGH